MCSRCLRFNAFEKKNWKERKSNNNNNVTFYCNCLEQWAWHETETHSILADDWMCVCVFRWNQEWCSSCCIISELNESFRWMIHRNEKKTKQKAAQIRGSSAPRERTMIESEWIIAKWDVFDYQKLKQRRNRIIWMISTEKLATKEENKNEEKKEQHSIISDAIVFP